MNNVMLDLETMGKGHRAAIVTIGAVFFDPMTVNWAPSSRRISTYEIARALGR